MKRKIKVFEAGTLRQALKCCLSEGYFPATMQEVLKMQYDNVIEHRWYDTSTLFYKGVLKTATLNQLKNIDKIYSDGGRLWLVGRLYGNGSAGGSNSLDDGNGGRLVGVAPEATKNKKEGKA